MNTEKTWPTAAPDWHSDPESLELLLNEREFINCQDVTLQEITRSSDQFPIHFPIQSVRCKTLEKNVDKNTLERNINSTYPVIHEHTLWLYAKFILFKRKHGSKQERALYKNLSVLDLVNRLLKKRAVYFVGIKDKYSLLDGSKNAGNWEIIGTDAEIPTLNLEKCISYDEIKLSALLSVSSYTYFINSGARHNKGIAAKERFNVENEGVIMGVIGARMKRKNCMEYQEIVVSKNQNTIENGYGNNDSTIHTLFANFYEEPAFLYGDLRTSPAFKNEPQRFKELYKDIVFDNTVYAKRLAISIDTLLIEANHKAKLRNKTAFIHVVGLGLGVWQLSGHQGQVFVDTFEKRLKALGNNLSGVSDVFFSYIDNVTFAGNTKTEQILELQGHPKKGIVIHFGKRDPHGTLMNEDKLLVVSYAWDGNALPGNEFWYGNLNGSGDSAAASSTQIAELHNPHINPKATAGELRIATCTEVITFKEYTNLIRNQCKKST